MTFDLTSQLEELRRVVHSDGRTARIDLKVGSIGGGNGTKVTFKRGGNLWRNQGARGEVCLKAQLGQMELRKFCEVGPRRIHLKLET